MKSESWPALPLASWQETYATLHMWTQIVGKIKLALTPRSNHWWNVALFLTARGLSTLPLRYGSDRYFDIEFDFVEHLLRIRDQDGKARTLALEPRTVADFYRELMTALDDLALPVHIWPVPVEVPDPIPFAEDSRHAAYDAAYASRCWRILSSSARVMEEFRAGFIGKCSPVHFFWGSFDLAMTRFSGRTAPERVGADPVTREAYSHEVISQGFWPGNRASGDSSKSDTDGTVREPAYYAYAAPEPVGLAQAPIRPESAFYSGVMKEFILPYEVVRQSDTPEQELRAFLESTYLEAAARAGWNREQLERR